MARRRRPEPGAAQPDDGVPDWLWGGCSLRRWLREHGGQLDGFHASRVEWEHRRRRWLLERGLVVRDMAGLTWEGFKRIEREEPHRILRRPEA